MRLGFWGRKTKDFLTNETRVKKKEKKGKISARTPVEVAQRHPPPPSPIPTHWFGGLIHTQTVYIQPLYPLLSSHISTSKTPSRTIAENLMAVLHNKFIQK